MRVGILGISYKSAEIYIREVVSKACRQLFAYEEAIAEKFHCVLLATCNRVEIYFTAEDLADAQSELLNFLRKEIEIPFEHKLYSYFGIDCFLHLAKVTAGLDSAIIAESEIQRQVKTAYEQTFLYYRLPSCMHYLFQKSLKLGKQIRSTLSLTENQITIEKLLFQISTHFLHELIDLPVLFIGNSEINRKVINYFKRKGVRRLSLCTRSLISAKEMAEKDHLTLLSWDELLDWQKYPLVICGTNAPRYLVEYTPHPVQTQLIFDLSVPRNVDPQLARHFQIALLNIEELSELIEKKQKKNLLEIDRAETWIAESVHRYLFSFAEKERKGHLVEL